MNNISYSHVSDAAKATEFVTNSKGIVEIKHILDGNYNIRESSVGGNYGYKLESGNTTWKYLKDNKTQTETGLKLYKYIGEGNTVNVNVTNKKQVVELKIVKKDTQNSTVLSNVEFVIKSSNNNKYIKVKAEAVEQNGKTVGEVTNKNGWTTKAVGIVKIKDSQNGSTFEYTSNKDEATKFVTANSGYISVKNLLKGNYTMVETNNPHYGYTKLVNTKIDNNIINNGNRQTIDNEKQVVELKIEKKDTQNSKALSNVEFVIKSSYNNQYIKVKAEAITENDQVVGTVTNDKNGWTTRAVGIVKIKDSQDGSTLEYTSNKDEATKFVTRNNGYISVKNLLKSSNGSNKITYTMV